ncbi:hypothetical protein ACTYVO_005245, partial [Escherichia coli]
IKHIKQNKKLRRKTTQEPRSCCLEVLAQNSSEPQPTRQKLPEKLSRRKVDLLGLPAPLSGIASKNFGGGRLFLIEANTLQS